MSRINFITFAKQNGYNSASIVRANTNGYKYITLADTETGNIENIYLGTRFSETVEVGAKLNLNELFVTETENQAGEKRWKITDKSGVMSEEKLKDYQTF